MAQPAGGKKAGSRRKAAPRRRAQKQAEAPAGPWAGLALAVLLAVLGIRLVILALDLLPVHSGEARLWAYAQELGWGYYAMPPLAAWVVRLTTELGGDSLFWLRLSAPIAHAAVGWLIFLTGRRIWDGETGFWAAAGYTAAPGVALSSLVMSPDPVVMTLWAAALYAMVRADAAEGPVAPRAWWAVTGALAGAGMLAGYASVAFVLGALASRLLPLRGRDWPSLGIAVVAAIAVMTPNIAWSAGQGFPGLLGLARLAGLSRDIFHPLELAEFTAAQAGLVGPVFLIAILLALRGARKWDGDRNMRLMGWLTVPLLLAVAVLALAGRSNAAWAAPAYVGGSLLAARWLITAGGWPALRAQLWVGVLASVALWTSAGLYAGQAERLTARLDPFASMRLGEPFCELSLGIMSDEGADALLSTSRRRLTECMFQGGLGWDEVAVWNEDGRPDSHIELVAGLQPGDDRTMLLVVRRGAARIAHHFREAREIEAGRLATHLDRDVPYEIWVVEGFRGY